MKCWWFAAGLGLAGVVATAALGAPADSVKYRQNVMKGIAAASGNLGAMIKGDVKAVPQHVRAQAEVVAWLSTLAKDAFQENTGATGPTEAKPEIWKNWPGFQEKAQALEIEAAKLVVLARADKPDMAAIAEQAKAVGGACGACHREFREKKS